MVVCAVMDSTALFWNTLLTLLCLQIRFYHLNAFFFPKVWEGLNVIKTGRVMLGETNPMDSKPGTIRGDLCVQVGRYICTALIAPEDRAAQRCHSMAELCCRLPALGHCGSVQRWREGCSAHSDRSAEQSWHSLPCACCCLTVTYSFCVQWRPPKDGVFFALRLEITLLLYQSFPRNIIHGSDSLESAEAEINLWFTPEELVDYRSCAHEWIYE